MTEQLRNFCFTFNNYTDSDVENIKNFEKIKYLIFGYEIAPTTGTKHLQGYVELSSQVRFKKLTTIFQHVEKRKGTAQQAITYCKKGGDFYEFGEKKEPGERNDLKQVAEKIIKGANLRDIAMNNPETFIKYSKGLTELKNMTFSKRNSKPYIEWRWGLTGVGKTRYCMEKHTSRYVKDGTIWWNGYNQEEAIIIDDFDGKWPFRDLLRLLDRYEYQGQYKGGYIHINSPYIYITCEFPPTHWWSGNELAQILRRIDLVNHITDTQSVSEVAGNTIPQPFNDIDI